MTRPSNSPSDKAAATGSANANDYDAVPYPSFSYTQTHPDVLATLATLLGMRPAPVEHCRVLELGCAGGGNLIPMAGALPGSRFVGIDLSARQVADARAIAGSLELQNVTFQQMDILDVSPDFGQFDYIIAHGIYSWVPPDVQEHVLTICRQNLAQNGVAYVSYNTYPGWHMLGGLRQMMLYRTRKTQDPHERVAQSKEFLKFMTEALGGKNTPSELLMKGYLSFLEKELEHLNTSSDAYLLHDELERVNDPVYFHQFAERAMQHGLQYVTDADFRMSMPHSLPGNVGPALRGLASDLLEMEQYIDFLNNRTFRRSLLCREEVTLRRTLMPGSAQSLFVVSRARPESTPVDVDSPAVVRFRDADGASFATDHPVSKAAMLYLIERRPRAVPFQELLDAARARVSGNPNSRARDAEVLGANLLTAYTYSGNLADLHTYAPALVTEAGERPTASRVARYQAPGMDRVTNLYHERVKLDPLAAFLLPHLDGQHDRAALTDLLLAGPVARGELTVQREGQPLSNPSDLRAALADELESLLRWLAFAALLTG